MKKVLSGIVGDRLNRLEIIKLDQNNLMDLDKVLKKLDDNGVSYDRALLERLEGLILNGSVEMIQY